MMSPSSMRSIVFTVAASRGMVALVFQLRSLEQSVASQSALPYLGCPFQCPSHLPLNALV